MAGCGVAGHDRRAFFCSRTHAGSGVLLASAWHGRAVAGDIDGDKRDWMGADGSAAVGSASSSDTDVVCGRVAFAVRFECSGYGGYGYGCGAGVERAARTDGGSGVGRDCGGVV